MIKTGIFIMALSVFAMGLFGCSPKTSADDDVPDMSILDTGKTTEILGYLNDIFPVGTQRTFVEKMLIDVAGAKYKGERPNVFGEDYAKNSHQYIYRRPLWRRGITNGRYLITVFYDEKDRVNHIIKVSGPTGL